MRALLAVAALLIVIATAATLKEDRLGSFSAQEDWFDRAKGHPMIMPKEVTPSKGIPGLSVDPASLPNDKPPPLDALRDRQSQAVFDARSQPGDFVTPPAISTPH